MRIPLWFAAAFFVMAVWPHSEARALRRASGLTMGVIFTAAWAVGRVVNRREYNNEDVRA